MSGAMVCKSPEFDKIRQEIQESETGHSELSTAIDDLAQRLADLKLNDDQIQVKHARLANQLMPINKLPSEIILEVADYLQFPGGTSSKHEDATPGVRRLAFVMSHVMHHWRSIVLDAPTLWSYIQIYPGQSMGFLQMSLTRSFECPLSISVITTARQTDRVLPQDDLRTLVHALSATTHRWESLSFDLGGHWEDRALDRNKPEYFLAPLREHHFPALKCLYTDLCDMPWGDLLSKDIVPLLKSVNFIRVPADMDTYVAARLTYLELRQIPVRHALAPSKLHSLLNSCSSLECLWLGQSCVNWYEDISIKPASIQLPTLKELWLTAREKESPLFVEYMLKSLSCPNLISMNFESFPPEAVSILLTVAFAATPSLPYSQVTALNIKRSLLDDVEKGDAIKFFTVFPSLKSLYLEQDDVPYCLRILSLQAGDASVDAKFESLCPLLRSLYLPGLGSDNAERVKDFIAIRMNMDLPVTSLTVDEDVYKIGVPQSIRDWMSANVEVHFEFSFLI